MNDIHIGELIRKEMRRQGKTNAWLAEQIGVTPRTANKIYSKKDIDTAQLLHISKALQHDFFGYYSILIPKFKSLSLRQKSPHTIRCEDFFRFV